MFLGGNENRRKTHTFVEDMWGLRGTIEEGESDLHGQDAVYIETYISKQGIRTPI